MGDDPAVCESVILGTSAVRVAPMILIEGFRHAGPDDDVPWHEVTADTCQERLDGAVAGLASCNDRADAHSDWAAVVTLLREVEHHAARAALVAMSW